LETVRKKEEDRLKQLIALIVVSSPCRHCVESTLHR